MKRILLSLLLILPGLAVNAAIERQLVQHQMSNSTVNALAYSEDGYLWIGTVRGLNRYNGSNFKVYSQQARLTDDNVSSLCPDTGGRLWIGTGSGISLLRDGQIDTSFLVASGRVFQIVSTDSNHLLFSTRGRLQLMDKDSGTPQTVFEDNRLSYNHFVRSPGGYIWINHLVRPQITVLDPSFRIVREVSLQGREIRQVSFDTDGSAYVCTDDGILHYSASGTPLPVPEAIERLCKNRNVLFFTHLWQSETLLLGIEGAGFFLLEKGEAPRHIFHPDYLDGVKYCRVTVSPENIWISRNRIDLDTKYLPQLETYIPVPNQYPQEALNKMYPWEEDGLLVITNKSIYRYQPSRQEVLPVRVQEINGTGLVGETMLDRRGRLWIVYSLSELRCYERREDGLAITFRCPVRGGSCLWDDADGTVHLLQPDGLLNIDPDLHLSHTPIADIPAVWYSDQCYNGRPYFLTTSGIWFLNAQTRFEQLPVDIQDPSTFYESPDGYYWIGTRHNGLFRYDPRTRELRSFPYGNAQADPSILSLAGTPDGHIWVCCRTEVSRIDPSGAESTVNYQAATHLNGSFSSNNNAITPDGTAYFGNIYQIIAFSEMSREQATHNIPLSLEGLVVNGVSAMEDLPQPLVLSHTQNQLSFYFSGLNFNPAYRPVYQYKLEGYDKEWVSADENLRAGYSALHPGKYTFRVRVQQPAGDWSPDELSQVVRIKPSPLLSLPMLVLYLLLLAGAVLFTLRQIVQSRMSRERLALSEQEKLLAEQMSQERTNFFTNISHEFRTPLALIWGPVRELSASSGLGAKEKKMVSIVERNAQRMIRLTDQLLQFNQSAASRDRLSLAQSDLSRLLRKMLENFEYMFREKYLTVEMDIPAEMPVYMDREKVEKVVFNLLSNAVKYTPENGRIKVSLRERDGKAVIEVADTGIGIAPDKLDRIFERYERLGGKVDDNLPTGFGIGLHYSRHLAELHKGTLSARANDPLGTVFTFAFPSVKEAYASEVIWEEEQQEAQETAEDASAGDTAVNVLVVEDNPDMQDYIRSILSPQYKVAVAGDGEQAWKVIRITAPDLIVSDVMMPYKDGYTLCKELKNDAEYCHLPIVLLTAKADMENQIRGLQLGADAYIAKPFDPQLLTTTIQNLLSNRRRIQHILSETPEALSEVPLGAHDKAFLEKLNGLVQAHLSEEDFNVTTLSLELGMSRTSLFSKTKALLGQSPQAYLLNCRLSRARELLKEGQLNVSEVAYRVGFATLTGFSRSFKNKYGIPPSGV